MRDRETFMVADLKNAVNSSAPHFAHPMKKLFALIFAVIVAQIATKVRAQEKENGVTSRSSATIVNLADGRKILSYRHAIRAAKPASYAGNQTWIIFRSLIITDANGNDETLFRPPGVPSETPTPPRNPDSLFALIDQSKIEVLETYGGRFELLRFDRPKSTWEFQGSVMMADFEDYSRTQDMASHAELLNWGTVLMHIRNGSKRALSIDQFGVVREDGDVYEYKRIGRSPLLSQEQHYKLAYSESVSEANAITDGNGVSVVLAQQLSKLVQQPHSDTNAPSSDTPLNANAELNTLVHSRPMGSPVENGKNSEGDMNRTQTNLFGWLVGVLSLLLMFWLWRRRQ